jgi:hypothetical protein
MIKDAAELRAKIAEIKDSQRIQAVFFLVRKPGQRQSNGFR